jgi:hypothetical protein
MHLLARHYRPMWSNASSFWGSGILCTGTIKLSEGIFCIRATTGFRMTPMLGDIRYLSIFVGVIPRVDNLAEGPVWAE